MFNLPFSIRISNEAPVDGDRYLSADQITRDNLISDGRSHVGLQVFQQDTKRLFILTGTTINDWIEVGGWDSVSGGAISRNSNVNIYGNLYIEGDIIQSGSSYETHSEQIYTKKDLIITREDAISPITLGEISGIKVTKYDGVDDLIFGADSSGYFKVGEVGSLQILSTRQDSPVSSGVSFWNNTNQRFDTNSNLVWTSTNRLGIGTTNPSVALDVNGLIRIRSGVPGVGKVLTSDATGTASWQTGGGGSSYWLSGSTGSIYYNGGNVGIGTTNPSNKLEVIGNSAFETISSEFAVFGANSIGYVYISDNYWYGGELGLIDNNDILIAGRYNGTYQYYQYGSIPGTSDGLFITTGTTINVGIGVTNPSSLFEIQGGLGTTGSTLTLGTKETSVVTNSVLGQINFYAPLESSTGDSRLVAASIVARAETAFTNTVNSTSIDFRTGASEIATTKMTLTSTGNLNLTTAAANIYFSGAGGVSKIYKNSGSINLDADRIIIGNNTYSYFGFGTLEKLTVTGNDNIGIRFSDGSPMDGWTIGYKCDLLGNNDFYIRDIGSTGGTFRFNTNGDFLTYGRVGIGTTNPSSSLEIQDGTGVTGATLTLGTKETTVVANDVLGRINFYAPLESDSGDSRLVGASIAAVANTTFSPTLNSTDIIFQTATSETATTKMIIKSNGTVGIGTTSPNYNLDVYTGSFRCGQATINTGINSLMIGYGFLTDEVGMVDSYDLMIAGRYLTYLQYGAYPGSSSGIVITTGTTSNIGIGITNPVSKLHVYENTTSVGTTAGLTVEQDGTGDAITQYYLTGGQRWVTGIDNSDSDKFKIASSTDLNTDAQLTITTTGNIGIGTTNPGTHKLHVNGGVNIDSYYLKTGKNTWGYLYLSDDNLGGEIGLYSEMLGDNYALAGYYNNYFQYGCLYGSGSQGLFITTGTTVNVGIGTTNPTYKLQVQGNIYGTGALFNCGDTSNFIVQDGAQGFSVIKYDATTYNLSLAYNDANVHLLIGSSTSYSIGGTENKVQLYGMTPATSTINLGCFNTTDANSADIRFYRSKNSGVGSATVVANGDDLGKITWYGAQQTGTFSNQNTAAQIKVQVDGTVTSGAGADMPGRIVFLTTPDASGTLTERMVIKNNGNVGIGTTNPLTFKLLVSGSTWVSDNIYSDAFLNSGTANGNTGIIPDGTEDNEKIDFYVADNIVMTMITTFGNVGIGTTSPSTKLDVNGNGRFRSVGSGTYNSVLNLTSDGTLTTATSDISMKENISTIDDSLNKILNLRGVYFNWKDEPEMGRRIGLIAQDVQTILPELVFTNKVDGLKGLNYAELTAVLVEAIKEQQKQIDELKSKI